MAVSLGVQITWLFVLALPIACVAWTFRHEEIFREPREYCAARCKNYQKVLQRKFFYVFTCEYCFSLSFANNPSGRKTHAAIRSITMVKATEFCDFDDRAMLHNLTLDRALLLERKMGTRLVVVAKVGCQHPLQMTGAQNNEVVQALPAYGSNQALP